VKKSLQVELSRIGPAAFRAVGASGGELIVDGAPDIGGEGRGMRPMELLISALASCAAMDVVHILTRQREPLTGLTIHVEAERKDATPAPLTAVHVRFVAQGGVDAHKLERAVALGVEKYCSVSASLDPSIRVTHEAVAEPA
jgi:putative redox protein